jgi:predicted ATPase
MITKLNLQRFRGFRALDVDLRPLTVVAGPNSSGKTSILHAIRMAVDALTIGLDEATPYAGTTDEWVGICSDHIVWDQERLCPVADWAELFTDREVREGTSIAIALQFEEADSIQALNVELAYARNYQLKMTVRVRSRSAREQVDELPKKSKFLSQRLREMLKDGLPKAVFVPAFYGVTRAEEYRTRALVDVSCFAAVPPPEARRACRRRSSGCCPSAPW